MERDAAADLWKHTLSQIPTNLGRLFYLAGLRDPNSGRYEHHGLAAVYSEEEADRILRESHFTVFSEWLRASLEQQKADLDLYLSSLTDIRRNVLEAWVRLSPYRTILPNEARAADRKLFFSDLETLLELLKNEYGVVSPDPDA